MLRAACLAAVRRPAALRCLSSAPLTESVPAAAPSGSSPSATPSGPTSATPATPPPAAPIAPTHATIEDFMKLELLTAKVLDVQAHPQADKLYVLSVDDGSGKERTICAGLKEFFSPEQLKGMSVVIVANLKPRKLRGVMSQGMVLAASGKDGKAVTLVSAGDAEPGSLVR